MHTYLAGKRGAPLCLLAASQALRFLVCRKWVVGALGHGRTCRRAVPRLQRGLAPALQVQLALPVLGVACHGATAELFNLREHISPAVRRQLVDGQVLEMRWDLVADRVVARVRI